MAQVGCSTSAEMPPRPVRRVARGEAGRVLAELRARDYIFTVLETAQDGPYQRIRFHGNGFLRDNQPYPTMWVRLWFPDTTGAGHQRAYTLVDPDVDDDTFWLEFVIHDGAAAAWALNAQVGDPIEASLYGSEPSLPEKTDVDRHVLIGDLASLPAINSLLDALGDAPTDVILECVNPTEKSANVRVRPQDSLTWVERSSGELLGRVDEAIQGCASAGCAQAKLGGRACPRVFAWGACDTVTTRALTKQLRAAGIPRDFIKTLGYWQPSVRERIAS